MYSTLVLLLGSMTASALGQSSSSSSTTSSIIPAGTALPGDYSGLLRPQLHFSPPQGFMNDPNGMFRDQSGTWHLYYQYNPSDTIAGNQHWGHATSDDLYTWTNQPIAIAPDNSTTFIYSGSAVVDVNNTSGFFPNQTNGVVAFYTAAGPTEQTQAIAYSYDDGVTFTKYAGNPILSVGSPHFRDPKVIWFEDHWVMVVAFAQEFAVSIYTSTNMIDWTHASNFSYHGLLGTQYECPNLVQMPMQGRDEPMWLMYISINPGAPIGGSIGQYFPGDFNGTHFTAVDAVARIADWGKDNYAAQFFYGVPGSQEQVSIAWASNWQYTSYVPTGPTEGWQSVMSLPRVNYLRNATRIGYTLVSLPYGLATLRQSENVASTEDLGANGTLFADVSGGSGAFMLDLNITGLNTTGLGRTASVNFTVLSSGSGEMISGGIFMASDTTMWLDRGKIEGFENVYYTDKFSTALVLEDVYDMQIIVDRSIIEVFALEGQTSATLVYYPEALLDTVVVRSNGLNDGVSITARVHSLASTWTSQQRANGTSVSKRLLLGERSWKS